MMEGTPQIVAFGGGGFSMEAGNPLMDEYVLRLAGRHRPAGWFPPSPTRGRPPRRPVLPALPGRSLRALARVVVPPRTRHRRRPARAPAVAGRHLRRRRQRPQAALRGGGAPRTWV